MAVGDLDLPDQLPRHTLRLASIVRQALERRGVAKPAQHVMVVGAPGWRPLTHTLVKNEPFTAEEIAKIEAFVKRERFTFWHRPDVEIPNPTARILLWPAQRLASFYAAQPLKLGPISDDSPFFLTDTNGARSRSRETYTRLGYAVPSPPARSCSRSCCCRRSDERAADPLPLRRVPRATAESGSSAARCCSTSPRRHRLILLEISLIQRFVLFLGYPTYSPHGGDALLLVSSGLGSLLRSA